MLIFVKLNRVQTICITVNPSDTIGSIKELIYKERLINPQYQRLTYHNDLEDLENDKTLSDYNILDYSTLRLFNDVSDTMEYLKAHIPKTTNEREFLVVTNMLIKINNLVKNDPYFHDIETLLKILGLLGMFLRFQKHIKFKLTNFITVQILELYKSSFEMLFELKKILDENKKENKAEFGEKEACKGQ